MDNEFVWKSQGELPELIYPYTKHTDRNSTKSIHQQSLGTGLRT